MKKEKGIEKQRMATLKIKKWFEIMKKILNKVTKELAESLYDLVRTINMFKHLDAESWVQARKGKIKQEFRHTVQIF